MSAEEKAGGKSKKITITNDKGRLSKEVKLFIHLGFQSRLSIESFFKLSCFAGNRADDPRRRKVQGRRRTPRATRAGLFLSVSIVILSNPFYYYLLMFFLFF